MAAGSGASSESADADGSSAPEQQSSGWEYVPMSEWDDDLPET